ncbi:DUF7573 domain-containing protein [Halorientalis sp.]|jgi:hypothetical protein|uniref:DUF7573 domain-containing protein n=1 Tax=Halorientalis sp. TaxID=1931229 RepID=UPI00262A329D|nr:hypothetical protein [Halorientalis sp.]
MDDTSLDEFVTTDDDGGEHGESPAPASSVERSRPEDGGGDGDEPSGGVALATSTYAWTGDGAVCGACGEAVARRWRGGDELVCADCKEW